jgi:peptide deformylase
MNLNTEFNKVSIKKQPQVLQILDYTNPILRKTSDWVYDDILHPEVQALMDDMVFTMNKYNGLGLAAPQIGLNSRIIVLNIDNQIYKMINPVVKTQSEDKTFEDEGCLSIPGLFKKIRRPNSVEVFYIDENGTEKVTLFHGIGARAVLHEIEHLDGKLFLDNLSNLERQLAFKKYNLLKRRANALSKFD